MNTLQKVIMSTAIALVIIVPLYLGMWIAKNNQHTCNEPNGELVWELIHANKMADSLAIENRVLRGEIRAEEELCMSYIKDLVKVESRADSLQTIVLELLPEDYNK